ncbi:MAG TPA: glycosyltransferase family 2 protein [Mucilaginibacter sp.]
MNFDITGAIVLYRNDRPLLLSAINSFLNTELRVKLLLVDNSPTDELKDIITDSRVVYVHNPANPGFGASHNYAINEALAQSKYHLVLNPDIYFESGVLEGLIAYMDANDDIGVVMPKILYPDGQIQYLAKLLPTPFDFIIRRFLPLKSFKEKMAHRFELRASGYDQIMDVPFLSGCFLVFRTEALKTTGGFDDKIFMYTEDIDICRRINQHNYRSVFYPRVHAYHAHERKSFLKMKTFAVYLRSAVYYFNKWGWFYDKERAEINNRTLSQIKT